jgi:hypothetical protein
MNSIFSNLQNQKQYKAATGLSIEKFEKLYSRFQLYYTPKQANPNPQGNQPVLTDDKEALFFILHYYKAYPTLQNLGLYFGFSEATASQYLDLIQPVFKKALSDFERSEFPLFSTQEEFDQAFEGIEDLLIDVTEVPSQRPVNEIVQINETVQSELYSGKKKAHTLKWLIITDKFKRVLFVAPMQSGHTHDFTIFKELFSHVDFCAHRVHVDLGFLGIVKKVKHSTIFIPFKKPKNGELTEDEKLTNQCFARFRVVVENAIAKIKSFFILRTKNRMQIKSKLNDAFLNCTALANFKINY